MILNNYQSQRDKMVEAQIIGRGITDKLLIRAMKKVERHRFLDEALWPEAYDDHPIPIGEKQTMSQPYIVALMTELLRLRGTERVLEIGTGSGYQAAVLAEIAEQVFSLERIPALAQRARNILDTLHYTNIVITVGDGTYGWKEHAPYDAIIVTAAAPTMPKPLLEQLKEEGRLVIPIGDEFSQDLIVFIKHPDGTIDTENYGGCRFVKLIGEHSWKK
jgi:protein-L-isoaspartate(D-aspartate) O-methyltransferase